MEYCECKETGVDFHGYCKKCNKKINFQYSRQKVKEGKKLLKEFETMKGMAELRALSKVSLERPLTDREYKRIMELKEKHLNIEKEARAWR